MKTVYGIDLGTTYSCISYIDEYGKPVVLKNSDGDLTTPSVVMVESADNIIVGIEAKRSIEIESDKTSQFIKRKMGKENDKVTLNSTEYSAPEISAYILKKLVTDGNNELQQTGILSEGEEIKDVVITCPAYFGMNERQATKTAGELAGLNVLNIINEPTAAAISYGVSGSDKNETVLVYDLGGGTFDITVMDINGSNITVICTGGDDQLGGKDWDECLMNYVIQKYEEEYGEDLSEDPEIIAGLYGEVEVWKKSLTSREKINMTVNGPSGRLREELTREKYEELTYDLLNRTKNLLDDVIRTSEKQGYPLEKIDKVLLVGGSSRMPQVAKMIEHDYKVVPTLADPDEAVAKGAAIYANSEKEFNDFIEEEADKSGKTVEEVKEDNIMTGLMDKKYSQSGYGLSKLNITNVLSRTYGLKTLESNEGTYIISNLLMINNALPASYTSDFYTIDDNQKGILISIYESRSNERMMPFEEQEPITEIQMDFEKTVPKETRIDVTFSLDNSGILHIKAIEQLHQSKLDTTFTLSNQMHESEVREVTKRMNNAVVE